jgi:hypothetical protein
VCSGIDKEEAHLTHPGSLDTAAGNLVFVGNKVQHFATGVIPMPEVEELFLTAQGVFFYP